ncbi:MAG TPA: hypothetical protein VLS28_10010, partial [Candidatus Sulfomarinibacteraceae bacterium]|nr:hypothetical protein [Candidatus Sulfomarinibacteraceae bacterium]
MTLPFRRRHHDDEASHDRARAIVATGFIEPTEPSDEAWLEGHLAGCGECRVEMEAYRTDRALLRGLADVAPEPPRDLWARTAASIEQEAARRHRGTRLAAAGPRLARLPLGVVAGVLVVLVVIGTSIMPKTGFPIGPDGAGSDAAAAASPGPVATPLTVTARDLSWVQGRGDGTFELVFASVDEVCITDPDACAPLEDASSTRLVLAAEPQAVVLSPSSQQLVIVSAPTAEGGGEVLVVSVPAPTPTPTVDPGASPSIVESPPQTEVPAPEPSPVATTDPNATAGPSGAPSASADPDAPRAILTGVVVVGDAEYSADGGWLAFSARPIDGSVGPDLYLWRVGDPVAAAVTADHRTFFAGWLGNQVLASRVEPAAPATGAETGDPSGSAATPVPSVTPAATPAATPDPDASREPSALPVEDHPVSFLLDPETAAVTNLAGADIWRPVVSPSSRTIVYWSGTLIPDGTGTGWVEGTGQLVLDGWVDPSAPPPASPDPGASADATSTPNVTPTPDASVDPLATIAALPSPGPAGSPVVLAAGPLAGFEASFDPTGTRLAVWVADPANVEIGTL